METHHHEWILTNKLGAYALGTGNLINQRKYHGLLIASDKSFNRNHLVAGIEEKVEWRGETIHLDSNNYSNCIYPEGFLHLVKPWLRPYPAFLYSALPHHDDILILKELMMDLDTNTVMVKYTNLGQHKLHFVFNPKYTLCPHHDINAHTSLDFAEFETGIQQEMDYSTFSALRKDNQIAVYGAVLHGEVSANRYVYYNVFYPWEVMSGYAGIGDQISFFQIAFDLAPGESNAILFSDTAIESPLKMVANIEARYAKLPKPMDFPKGLDSDGTLLSRLDYNDNILFNRKQYLEILEFALTDFVANDDIVAGYPFYGAWGRDTMVVLNALLHSDKYLDLIQKILMNYSRYIVGGLIPNVFAETGREANYDSIDATLWYIIMLWKLGKKKNSQSYWKEVILLTEEILQSIMNQDEHLFDIREDGLIELSPAFAHGTWMDVRIDGKAVTPRWGAPVEINALWYNALASYEAMCEEYSALSETKITAKKEHLSAMAKVKASFGKFWNGDYLADRLEGDTQIVEIRPNALIALSLPWSVVDESIMKQVWERSFSELYTFYGLRTLSPKDPKFRKKYYGTQKERDLSYHNGSVWAWLMGPFCGLYLKINRKQKTDQELAEDLGKFIGILRNGFMRGHIASVAEVWDGENPHFPKGAPAQAWSVAALYNIEMFIESLGVKS